jgi:K+-transporting ATPase ATPase C chain
VKDTLVIALRATLVTLVLTGVIYPLAVTGVAQVLFPYRANGSMVTDQQGNEVGSELIAQGFSDQAYLWPRPSASGYDGSNSSGTNLAVTSQKLRDGDPPTVGSAAGDGGSAGSDVGSAAAPSPFEGITGLDADYRTANSIGSGVEIPADAVTRSASGLDPHISPENARMQIGRIAAARGISQVDRVAAVIEQYTEGRTFGIYGEPKVNVLLTNLALDRTFGKPGHAVKTSRDDR